jgi:hypothetical protein
MELIANAGDINLSSGGYDAQVELAGREQIGISPNNAWFPVLFGGQLLEFRSAACRIPFGISSPIAAGGGATRRGNTKEYKRRPGVPSVESMFIEVEDQAFQAFLINVSLEIKQLITDSMETRAAMNLRTPFTDETFKPIMKVNNSVFRERLSGFYTKFNVGGRRAVIVTDRQGNAIDPAKAFVADAVIEPVWRVCGVMVYNGQVSVVLHLISATTDVVE